MVEEGHAMPRARSSVLYYPHIDITDGGLLRESLLLWDKIQTIVPGRDYTEQRIDDYDQDLLRERRILSKLYVTTEIAEGLALEDEVEEFLTDPRGGVVTDEEAELVRLHPQKLGRRTRELVDSVNLFRLHPEKLSHEVGRMLESSGGLRMRSRDEFAYVDGRFAEFYMTLLASRLAKTRGLGLVTDSVKADKLASSVILDVATAKRIDGPDHYELTGRHRFRPPESRIRRSEYVQGLLLHTVLRLASPAPDANIGELLRFKERHADELGRFRQYVARLATELEEIEDLEALEQAAQDIVTNEIRPALNDLERALRGFGFQHLVKNVVKFSTLKASGTGGALAYLSTFNAPLALAVAAGVNIAYSVVTYREERDRRLRESPLAFAHLLKRRTNLRHQ